MDPLQDALSLLKEAQQTLAMQAEEIQTLRQQIKKPGDNTNGNANPMQKKASLSTLTTITGLTEKELPDFVKVADEKEIQTFVSSVEKRVRHNSMGKVAEIHDGSQAESPEEQLEAALSGLIG